jgi:hypothetical protein
MAYKTKIVPDGSGFIGHLFADDQLVYTTRPHKDPIMASRELGTHVAKITAPAPIPNNTGPAAMETEQTAPRVMRNISSAGAVDSSTGTPTPPEPTRRCCGR